MKEDPVLGDDSQLEEPEDNPLAGKDDDEEEEDDTEGCEECSDEGKSAAAAAETSGDGCECL